MLCWNRAEHFGGTRRAWRFPQLGRAIRPTQVLPQDARSDPCEDRGLGEGASRKWRYTCPLDVRSCGAGKSAIAQSIAELCEALLAAAFFFSRTSVGRNGSSRLVATISWQLIQAILEIRNYVLSSLERDPTILFRTPATQMKSLVVDPLNSISKDILIKRPPLVIIEGLDECLSTSLQQLNTPLYFLIASRPHTNIRAAFASNPFRAITNTLHLRTTTNPPKTFVISLHLASRRSTKNAHIFPHPGPQWVI